MGLQRQVSLGAMWRLPTTGRRRADSAPSPSAFRWIREPFKNLTDPLEGLRTLA